MQNRKFKIHYNFVFDNLIQEFGENPADAHTYRVAYLEFVLDRTISPSPQKTA